VVVLHARQVLPLVAIIYRIEVFNSPLVHRCIAGQILTGLLEEVVVATSVAVRLLEQLVGRLRDLLLLIDMLLLVYLLLLLLLLASSTH